MLANEAHNMATDADVAAIINGEVDIEGNVQTEFTSSLASFVRRRWDIMWRHHNSDIQPRLTACIRSRNRKYDEEKLAAIKKMGGSEIFMGVASAKSRTATAWLRDALTGSDGDKPWSIRPTPMPELPEVIMNGLRDMMQEELMRYYQNGGVRLSANELREIGDKLKESVLTSARKESLKRVRRMEKIMEDQLHEGGFRDSMFAFTDDLATYPFAVLKGPIPKVVPRVRWGMEGPESEGRIVDTWSRVDPFRFFWAPWGDNIHDIPIVEMHYLTREQVEGMLDLPGVGFSEPAVRSVLRNFGHQGLSWIYESGMHDEATHGRDYTEAQEDLVIALQLWDRIPGNLLIEWGVSSENVLDPDKSYPCDVWLIHNTVVKAVLNYDPLGRKPYYVTSFEKIPGRIDGNGVIDLGLDLESVCNSAARALCNNMGIASGPQVGVNVSRLPAGQPVSTLAPWDIWQYQDSRTGNQSGGDPINFFQPQSNAQELMNVYNQYFAMVDEITGIPRYMTGSHVPGAGRTSSGLAMLISNAGKSIKQVLSNVDSDIIEPVLRVLYQKNLRTQRDVFAIGDVMIQAKGTSALVVKESEAMRQQEFLSILLGSPILQDIFGFSGIGKITRDLARNLNLNILDYMPSDDQLDMLQKQRMIQAQLEAQMQAGGNAQSQPKPQKPANTHADGSEKGGRAVNTVSPRPNGE